MRNIARKPISLTDPNWEWSRQVVTLAGCISSSAGLKGHVGVAVWIENNQHKQTTKVDSHGWFYFLNLPKGDYALTIDKQGNGEEVVLSVQLWQFKENKGRREAEVVLDERQEDESLKKAPSTGRKVRIS